MSFFSKIVVFPLSNFRARFSTIDSETWIFTHFSQLSDEESLKSAMEASSTSSIVVEEWNGSSSTKLCKTATITASPSITVLRFAKISPFSFSSPKLLSLCFFFDRCCFLFELVDQLAISAMFGGEFSKLLSPRQGFFFFFEI